MILTEIYFSCSYSQWNSKIAKKKGKGGGRKKLFDIKTCWHKKKSLFFPKQNCHVKLLFFFNHRNYELSRRFILYFKQQAAERNLRVSEIKDDNKRKRNEERDREREKRQIVGNISSDRRTDGCHCDQMVADNCVLLLLWFLWFGAESRSSIIDLSIGISW